MAEANVLIGGSNVKGDITSCKIENQEIATARNSIWSWKETKTFVSYDVCNKQIIRQYDIPQWTASGGLGLLVSIFIGCLLLWAILSVITENL